MRQPCRALTPETPPPCTCEIEAKENGGRCIFFLHLSPSHSLLSFLFPLSSPPLDCAARSGFNRAVKPAVSGGAAAARPTTTAATAPTATATPPPRTPHEPPARDAITRENHIRGCTSDWGFGTAAALDRSTTLVLEPLFAERDTVNPLDLRPARPRLHTHAFAISDTPAH